ncbi:membrane protein insertion efficiency factor YidD [Janibacter alkaliphilus]|uniref:Putative membrane protein insertion efficiency factor n=1 Tax=Janibacter alkaliphilus TaxID=1069963 RepID=A0A852XDM6_9MICO|nr:hypothetical protein [Janibacter alkaliphilus]
MSRASLRRVAALPLVALVRAYQLLISPLLPPSCRYFPSCSEYGLTALRRFGPLSGTYLMLHRIARCHPWSAGGIDHVPDTWADRGSPELARPRLATDDGHDHGAERAQERTSLP